MIEHYLLKVIKKRRASSYARVFGKALKRSLRIEFCINTIEIFM